MKVGRRASAGGGRVVNVRAAAFIVHTVILGRG
jgi:hypothetical protein